MGPRQTDHRICSIRVGKTNKLLNILSGLSQQHTPDHLRAQVLSISTMPHSWWGAALIIGLGTVVSVVTINKDFTEISLDTVRYNGLVHSFTQWTLSHFWVYNEEVNYNKINFYRDEWETVANTILVFPFTPTEKQKIHYCIYTIIQKKMDLPQQELKVRKVTPSASVLESTVYQKVKY